VDQEPLPASIRGQREAPSLAEGQELEEEGRAWLPLDRDPWVLWVSWVLWEPPRSSRVRVGARARGGMVI